MSFLLGVFGWDVGGLNSRLVWKKEFYLEIAFIGDCLSYMFLLSITPAARKGRNFEPSFSV